MRKAGTHPCTPAAHVKEGEVTWFYGYHHMQQKQRGKAGPSASEWMAASARGVSTQRREQEKAAERQEQQCSKESNEDEHFV